MVAQKLEKLLIAEVSGVDDPANEIPGWMVTKNADAGAVPRAGGLLAIKGRRVGDDLFVAVEDCSTVIRYRMGGGSQEITVGDDGVEAVQTGPGSRGAESSLHPALQGAKLTLPWRDATACRYHRIF